MLENNDQIKGRAFHKGGEIELLNAQLQDIFGLTNDSSKRASAKNDHLRMESDILCP